MRQYKHVTLAFVSLYHFAIDIILLSHIHLVNWILLLHQSKEKLRKKGLTVLRYFIFVEDNHPITNINKLILLELIPCS